MLKQKLHIDIFELPLMDIKFGWASETLEALIAFCKWQVHNMEGRLAEGDAGHWTEYIAAVKRLLTQLEGGCRKKIQV